MTRMNTTLQAMGLVNVLLLCPTALQGATVELPAGSVDALSGALADAGPHGTVIVKAGIHVENATVFVTQPVSIYGEPGAVIESATTQNFDIPTVVDPSFHVLGTQEVLILGLEIRPPVGTFGNTAIAIESSNDVTLTGNTMTDYQFGVIVELSNRARIEGNTLVMDPNPAAQSLGITVVNGREAEVHGNRVSQGLFGIWACDREGRASGNVVSNNLVGLILCRVPSGSFLLSGTPRGAEAPATQWSVQANEATGNVWGYLSIDGSSANTLSSNAASGNVYDIEPAGDSFIFGFFTPTSTDNVVHTGRHHDLVIKDCAPESRILGKAILVDTSLDPCF